jgi:hypothetical protein
MTAGLWTPTNSSLSKIASGQFDIDSDSYKCGLLQSTSNIGIASGAWSSVTNEVAAGNGYSTGGVPVSLTINTGAATNVTDAVWGTPSGNSVTITSAGNGLPVIAAGAMFRVREHSNPANEGVYFATGSPTAGSLPAIKIGSAPVASASEAVNIKAQDTIVPSANIVFTASGGSIAARLAALYEVGGDVLAYMLLDATPADVTVTSGNALTINNSVPVFMLA